MKNLIYFFAGIILVTLVSATTVSVMTIKPETPKGIVVFSGDDDYCKSTTIYYSKKGYIFKHSSQSASKYGNPTIFVIMEKF